MPNHPIESHSPVLKFGPFHSFPRMSIPRKQGYSPTRQRFTRISAVTLVSTAVPMTKSATATASNRIA